MKPVAPGTDARIAARLLLAPALLALAACGSFGRPVNQEVLINPMSGNEQVQASCSVSNDRGTWSVIAPTKLGVTRSSTSLAVSCTDSEGRKVTRSVEASVSASSRLGLDGKSAYDYPSQVTLDMDTGPADPLGETIAVATRHTLPIDDLGSVPHVDDSGRAGYQRFLAGPSPRAFAIAENGYWVRVNGSRGADHLALSRCQSAGVVCSLYAVDNQVVWPVAERELLAAR